MTLIRLLKLKEINANMTVNTAKYVSKPVLLHDSFRSYKECIALLCRGNVPVGYPNYFWGKCKAQGLKQKMADLTAFPKSLKIKTYF